MFKSALLILSGNAMASLLLLARNLIIARLIPVEDYGIAATFAVAMAVVEMASAFGLQQQIVQSKEGDDPKFQAGLQGFQLLRGVISGAILFLLAGPLAAFLGIPEVAWAYQVLALVPVLNALQHFDIHRLTRAMRFKALLLTGSLPALISLIAVWPMVMIFGNWQVMLWALIVQAALAALVSHICAERRWQLSLDRAILAQSIRFGWPLLLNSTLMFLVFQGDKLIVGRLQGMEALAVFSMGVTLFLTPTLVFAKSTQNLFLPKLSAAQDDPEVFASIAQSCLKTVALAALILVLGTLLLGEPIVHLLLGEKYAALLPLLIWFAVSQSVRMMRNGPSIVGLALGQTTIAMYANLPRLAVMPVGAWALLQGATLETLLILATLGESLGLVLGLALVIQRADLPRVGAMLFQLPIYCFIIIVGYLSVERVI